jgi:hypothetical protein
MKLDIPLFLKCLGGVILFMTAGLYWRPLLLGWTLSPVPVGLFILAAGCFWLAGELKPSDKPDDQK